MSSPAPGAAKFRTRFHPAVLSGAVGFALATIGIVGLIVVRNSLSGTSAWELGLAGLVAAVGGFVGPIVRWQRSEFAVTAEGLFVRTGFLRAHEALFPHDTVQTVEVHSTTPGRLLDYGTVRIVGTDDAYEELPRVAHAEAFRDAALAAAPASRRRRSGR